MIDVYDGKIYVGSVGDLYTIQENDNEWSFVHATQTTHYKLMGWDRKTNKPNQQSPNYIFYENGNHLSINWVDSENPKLYEWTGVDGFKRILDFIDKWINSKKVFVHCDQGQSRSPTIALLYLAKRKNVLPNDSYFSAKQEFSKLYPMYNPKGIGLYVGQHWNEIT